jgi:hypothetical protein
MNIGYHPLWLTFYDSTLNVEFRQFLVRKGISMWQLVLGQFVYTIIYLPYCAICYEKNFVTPFEGPHLFLWLTAFALCIVVNLIGATAVLIERYVDFWCNLSGLEKKTLESLAMSMRFYYVALLSSPIGLIMSIRSLVRCPTVTAASTMFFCNYSGNRDIPTDHFIFLMLCPIFTHVAVPVEWGAILICWPVGLLFIVISMYLSGDPAAPGLSVLLTCSTLTYVFAGVYCLSVMINYNIQTKMMFTFLLNIKETDGAFTWQHRGNADDDYASIGSYDDDNASTISTISSVTGTMRTEQLSKLRLRKRRLVMAASSAGSVRQIVTKLNNDRIRQEQGVGQGQGQGQEQKGVGGAANHIDAKPMAQESRLSTVADGESFPFLGTHADQGSEPTTQELLSSARLLPPDAPLTFPMAQESRLSTVEDGATSFLVGIHAD